MGRRGGMKIVVVSSLARRFHLPLASWSISGGLNLVHYSLRHLSSFLKRTAGVQLYHPPFLSSRLLQGRDILLSSRSSIKYRIDDNMISYQELRLSLRTLPPTTSLLQKTTRFDRGSATLIAKPRSPTSPFLTT